MQKLKHLQTIIKDAVAGECICACCGIVIEENMPVPENQAFHIDDVLQKKHTEKISEIQHDGGLGTVAAPGTAAGFKINMWQSRLRITTPEQTRLASYYQQLNFIASKYHTPSHILQTAFALCRHAEKNHVLMRKRRESFCMALLFAAYRITDTDMTLKTFMNRYNIQHDSTFKARYVRLVTERFGLKPGGSILMTLRQIRMNPLQLSKNTVNLAVKIFENAERHGLTGGSSPHVIAALCSHIAAVSKNTHVGQLDDIAKAFGISPASVQNKKTQWRDILDLPGIVMYPYRHKRRIERLGYHG